MLLGPGLVGLRVQPRRRLVGQALFLGLAHVADIGVD
jgi:hypothetical protein